MSKQKQTAITEQRRLRLHERAAAKQPASRPEQAESPKRRDDGPRVVGYKPEAPPWARADWQPARTGPAVSESLAAWQRAKEWAELRHRLGGGGYDDMGNRIGVPPGFDWMGNRL